MRSRVPFVLVALCSLSPLAARTATATCCTLRKLDADPPSAQFRVCGLVSTPDCVAWLYEGTLAAGESAAVCAASDRLSYQEWDAAAATWGPATEARCEEGGAVEL